MSYICCTFFFFNDTSTTEIYTLSLHDALPICYGRRLGCASAGWTEGGCRGSRPKSAGVGRVGPQRGRMLQRRKGRSEEHTSELQSRRDLVCRLLLEKKKKKADKTL